MFRVSRRVDYGLKLLIALAADDNTAAQATSRLAERLEIPLAFLHQIGRSLIQAGILRSSPGPGGGLRLNQPPEKITLLQVLETLDGPVRLSACLEDPEACGHDESCTSYQMWTDIQARLTRELSQIRLSTLAHQQKGKNNGYYPVPEFSGAGKSIAA
jgi:Rrf2 family protein